MIDIYWRFRHWLWRKTRINWFLHPIHKRVLHFYPDFSGDFHESVDKFMNALETIIPFGPTTQYALNVTGEEYREYALGIKDPNDKKRECLFYAMVNTIRKQILSEPLPFKAFIYWRIKPEFSTWQDDNFDSLHRRHFSVTKDKIYMRFLVSHKSPIKTSKPADLELLRT